ncbi:MAG: ATP-binding protein [Desulfobacteria bacterium]|nr:ATP-binding protein [Deltaproteobacteria bacterium]
MVSTHTYPRLLFPPKGSFFLFGPRGTGKSTWLRTTFPSAHTIDLLDESLYQSLLADIGRFAGELRAVPKGTVVVVDEIQRIPSLLNEVHRHIEDRGLRFVLCGSSARRLKTAGTNLLAGRAVRRNMHPLLPEELGRDFDIESILRWGSLPVVWSAPDREEALAAYAQLYLKEEVQAEALVRNLPGFARFLPIAGLFHGQVINIAGIGRDAGVARTTISGYLTILEDTMLTFTLPAFEARLRVRERRHPKLYWADSGIPRAMKRQLGPVAAEERGHLFEGWIASVLRAYRDYGNLFDEWFYWAAGKGSGVEVDFLLRKGSALVAIEVKSSRNVREAELTGLRAITELPGVRRRLVVHMGDRSLATGDGIEILPVPAFLREVERGTIFP